jgi:hypothetical protein
VSGGGNSPDQLFYQLVVSQGAQSSNSAPVELNVYPATAPVDTAPPLGGFNAGANTTPSAVETYIGSTVIFTASFVGTTPITSQWQSDIGNPGTFTNIPGQTGNSLTLTGVGLTNVGNYRLVATNSQGSAASTPAPLSVASLIYQQPFTQIFHGNQSINNLGWRDDVNSQDTRFFTDNDGLTYPAGAWYSGGTASEDMWVDAAIENGSVTNVDTTGHPNISEGFQPPFPVIPLSGASNIAFTVNGISTYNPALTANFFLVQMNGNTWYSSTTQQEPTEQYNPTTYSLTFNTNAANWNRIAISPNGSVGEGTLYPIILGPATNNLTGTITGAGVLCTHPGGNSDDNFTDFTVLGSVTYSCLPQLNSSPASVTNYTGTTATLDVAATTNSATNFTTAGLTFQWKSGATNASVSTFTNVPNSGQFSGATTEDLVISNVSAASDDKSFVVVVTDGCGSVTSAPAVLTVVDSAPVVTAQTTITPNSFEINNNVQATLSAAFGGTLPITYQWIGAPGAITNTNVVLGVTNITIVPVGTVTNVPGATTPTYVFTNPGTNLTGWYSLRASNSISAGTPTTNTWAQLTVLPHTGNITWAAPVAFAGQTAAQILSVPGQFVSAEFWGANTNISVYADGQTYVFAEQGAGFNTVYTGPSSGNTNMDSILNDDVENFGTSSYSVSGLVVGRHYSLQLFGVNDTGGSTRPAYWSDQLDANDISRQFEMGDNVYTVGTFTATNTTQGVTENEPIGGYISTIIVRAQQPNLTLTLSGANVILNCDLGTSLASAPTVTGPWTTNTVSYPVTVPASGTQKYFRAIAP